MKKTTKNQKQGKPGKSKKNRSLVKRNRQEQHKGKHQETSAAHYYIGTLDVNSRGNGYVVVEGLEQRSDENNRAKKTTLCRYSAAA